MKRRSRMGIICDGGTSTLPEEIAAPARFLVLLAWEAGELSEEQAIDALQMPRVAARKFRAETIAYGVQVAEILRRATGGQSDVR